MRSGPAPPSESPPARASAPAIALYGLALVALLAMSRPYAGIDGDARLYIGSALAALDPAGVGQDLMFRFDGQFGFSLYPVLLKGLVRALGPSAAAMAATLAGLLAWLAGAALLMRGLTLRLGRASAFAAIACTVILPAQYGAFGAFQIGEALAVPRPFAEAAVMAGLAALLASRSWTAVACLALAAAFHPIMAIPGIAAALVFVALEDRRWWFVVAAGALALVAAAALSLPIADRLFVRVDPAWLAVLHDRSTYLFPSHWPLAAWTQGAVRLATVLIAAAMVQGAPRRLLLAVAVTALAGVTAAAALGDALPMLLVIQLQPWRVLWLLTVAGAAGIALGAIGLWRRGVCGRIALALLAIAWLSLDAPVAAIPAIFAALALTLLQAAGRAPALTPLTGRATLAAAALLALVWLGRRLSELWSFFESASRASAHPGWAYVAATDVLALPVAVVAIGLALGAFARLRRSGRAAALVATGSILAVASLAWDSRAPGRAMIDTTGQPPALVAALGRPGEVLWLGGDTEAWLLAGRASWANRMQASGTVFSRDLALAWRPRMQDLLGHGVATAADVLPFTSTADAHAPLPPSAPAVRALCGRPDGPAAVVAPGWDHAGTPQGYTDFIWTAPRAAEILSEDGERLTWRKVLDYTVIRCP